MTYIDLPKRWLDFDLSQPMLDLAAATCPNLQAATAGVSTYLEQLAGTGVSSGGFRHYTTIGTFQYDARVRATVEASAAKVAMFCLWGEGWTDEAHYSNDAMRKIAAGHFDTLLRSRLSTFPIGRRRVEGQPVRLRLAFVHEADWYGRNTLEPRAYIAAVQHLIQVAVDWALANEVTPDELGVGGLLTSTGMENGQWPWWRALPDWVLESNMVVGFWDHYFKVAWSVAGLPGLDGQPYTHEPIARLGRHMDVFHNAGIHRFVLAETALGYDSWNRLDAPVATPAHHLAWVKELQQLLRQRRGFEGVMTFHSPGAGGMSKFGGISEPGREDVARQVATLRASLNIVP